MTLCIEGSQSSDAEQFPDYYEQLFEVLPCAALVLDQAASIVNFNRAGFALMAKEPSEEVMQLLAGEALGCVHANEGDGCGTTPFCRECGLWRVVTETLRTRIGGRRIASMSLVRNDTVVETRFLLTTAPITLQPHFLTLMTLQDLGELSNLEDC